MNNLKGYYFVDLRVTAGTVNIEGCEILT